jgi:hypothetical protein
MLKIQNSALYIKSFSYLLGRVKHIIYDNCVTQTVVTGSVRGMGEERKCTRFWWETQKERGHSEDRGVDGRMGSEWILDLGGMAGGFGVDSIGSG